MPAPQLLGIYPVESVQVSNQTPWMLADPYRRFTSRFLSTPSVPGPPTCSPVMSSTASTFCSKRPKSLWFMASGRL